MPRAGYRVTTASVMAAAAMGCTASHCSCSSQPCSATQSMRLSAGTWTVRGVTPVSSCFSLPHRTSMVQVAPAADAGASCDVPVAALLHGLDRKDAAADDAGWRKSVRTSPCLPSIHRPATGVPWEQRGGRRIVMVTSLPSHCTSTSAPWNCMPLARSSRWPSGSGSGFSVNASASKATPRYPNANASAMAPAPVMKLGQPHLQAQQQVMCEKSLKLIISLCNVHERPSSGMRAPGWQSSRDDTHPPLPSIQTLKGPNTKPS